MEITRNDLMTARDYIYELSQTILKLNTIYNQEISNKRVKYWIKDKYLISYDFSSYKWRFLRIYDFDCESEIAVEGKTDMVTFSDLFDQLLEKIDNDEWAKDE